jgi:hypothetical protein
MFSADVCTQFLVEHIQYYQNRTESPTPTETLDCVRFNRHPERFPSCYMRTRVLIHADIWRVFQFFIADGLFLRVNRRKC